MRTSSRALKRSSHEKMLRVGCRGWYQFASLTHSTNPPKQTPPKANSRTRNSALLHRHRISSTLTELDNSLLTFPASVSTHRQYQSRCRGRLPPRLISEGLNTDDRVSARDARPALEPPRPPPDRWTAPEAPRQHRRPLDGE